MVYKNFRFNIVLRIVLIAVTIFLFFYVIESNYYIIPVFLMLLVVVQVYLLVGYVDKTNRDVSNFLESIRYSDFTRTYQVEGLGASFDELKEAFNNVIADFQKIRAEKEEHYFYLQNIIQHIGIAVIAYLPDGEIEMINKAAKKLVQIDSIKNIRAIEVWSKALVDLLESIKTGENALLKVQDKDEYLQLSIYATEFKIENRVIKLVSIKNIQAELEEKEMEAWQKLIRVLTHEIMNSIAPIASLTSTSKLMVQSLMQGEESGMDEDEKHETIQDISDALQTIHKRSTGLIHFVETYRNLTRIPKPNFTIFSVHKLFNNTIQLLQEEFKNSGIDYTVSIDPPSLELTADEQLIEQVLINLVKNAIQALKQTESPEIQLKAYLNRRDRVTIQVADNGQGILQEVIDKIFIPFFTTKTSGSGIGLSLSKQIMRLHGGSINVSSEIDKETIFILTF